MAKQKYCPRCNAPIRKGSASICPSCGYDWGRRGAKKPTVKKEYKMKLNRRRATRATGSGSLIPAKLKRMPNGTYKVYVAPGQMVKLRANPSATETLLYNKFRREGYSVTEAERLAKLNAPYYERGKKAVRKGTKRKR